MELLSENLGKQWETDGIAKGLEFKFMYFFEILQNHGKPWSSVFQKPWENKQKSNGNHGNSRNTQI